MSDTLGRISVPTYSTGPTFPLKPDYPYSQAYAPGVAIHRFGSRDAKTEQRFYLGTGAKRFSIRCSKLTPAKHGTLRDFWIARQGAYGQFVYACPSDDRTTTTNYTVRFAHPQITFETAISNLMGAGLDLVEIPSTSPTYAISATLTRFPSSGFAATLLGQTHTFIPLLKITPMETACPAMYISDRRVTVGAQLYIPRLLSWNGISQGMDGQADTAGFQLGNADRVMTAIANDVDLWNADIEFSLFHVGSTTLVNFWKGNITEWRGRANDPVFTLQAADALASLNYVFPTRKISRTCWKPFNDGNACPYAAHGTGGDATKCDKGFSTSNGCQAHGMDPYFGGIIAVPQTVRTKDNSTGTFGFGRSPLVSSSQIADSIYDEVVPEIYVDCSDMDDVGQGFPVNAKLAAGRDEGDFYTGLGIVGEGPIGEYARTSVSTDGGTPVEGYYGASKTPPANVIVSAPHKLDGQAWHGWPQNNYGLRQSYGHDPAVNNDPDAASDQFSLGQGGSGPQTYGTAKAGALAFMEIRRSDTKGLQLSTLAEHAMQVTVRKGRVGRIWTAPGSSSIGTLSNPVWVAVDAYLRSMGLRYAAASEQEKWFDVAAAVAAAAICDLPVTPLFGTGTEKQFQFQGIIQEEKPLRDWLTEILNNCLGYYTRSFGKLKIGIRSDSSVIEAFSDGNILWGSLDYGPRRPAFNDLTGLFSDKEFGFVGNSVYIYDDTHATLLGGANGPRRMKSNISLNGSPTKSQTGRIITCRLREELGGINADQFKASRDISFKTTILALNVEPGMICSVTHDDLPTYPAAVDGSQAAAPNYVEFRVKKWTLNPDFSIDVEGTTTHNDMYDLVNGPKPQDVAADPLPVDDLFAPAGWDFDVQTNRDGTYTLRNFSCGQHGDTVHQGTFETFYVEEHLGRYGTAVGSVGSAATTFSYAGPAPTETEWLMLGNEIMQVTEVSASGPNTGDVTVLRAQLGTSAVAHNRISTTVSAINADWDCEFTIAAGLALIPGMRLVGPTGNQAPIASYDSATGIVRTTLPIAGLAVGNTVYSDWRLWRITKRTDVVPFPPRFFRSAARATTEVTIPLKYAAIVAVRGQLENTRGLTSEYVIDQFTGETKLRTLGHTRYVLPYPNVPTGDTDTAFTPILADEDQPFQRAYAELDGGPAGPYPTPSTTACISRKDLIPIGTITIGGTISSAAEIEVSFSGANNFTITKWSGKLAGITGSSTTANVATSLAAALNADSQFSAGYYATSEAAVVYISDVFGTGGTLAAAVGGGITATCTGLTSSLGILTGRSYAFAFTGGGYRSELSSWTSDTGPTGSASKIELANIPGTGDSRITAVEIYAAPDGLQTSPRLVGTASPGATVFYDTLTETALASATAYPGATQPAGSAGDLFVTVTQDGSEWFTLRIPAGSSRSNIADGYALDPIGKDSSIDANISNDAGAVDLRLTIE